MRRIMVDIETLSTDIANALIVSVAAIEFSLQKDAPRLFKPRMWVLDPREQLALGRLVSPRTVDWWRTQPDAARDLWVKPRTTPLAQFTTELRAMFANPDTLLRDDTAEVWSNGVAFDITNLTALYLQANAGTEPWAYNMVRDARTIYRVYPAYRSRPESAPGGASNTGTPHDPASDCVHQVWGLWEHWPGELMD